jgi:glycosyltransferase involved in cell wall biosynthesis
MIKPYSFSVVIPLYNHERYIAAALDSVLKQTRPPLDIILVDDGSSDNGYNIAEKILHNLPNSTIIKQDNRGAHNALNRAIELSKGSHIAVLNSDDLFKPHKLERCERIFRTDSDINIIFGRVEIIDSEGVFIPRNETTEWLDRCYTNLRRYGSLSLALLNENFGVTTSNFVFKRELWKSAGGFKNLRYCHDLDFLMAASRYGKPFFDERGGHHISYRVHPTNTIKETLEKVHYEIAAVIASALDCNTLALGNSLADSQEQQEIEDILNRKGLSAKVASLIPYRRTFEFREELYNEITGNRKELAFEPTAGLAKSSPPNVKTRITASIPTVKKFTVAIELSNFDRGGLEKVVLDCAIDFRRCGVEPIIISCGNVGHLGSIAKELAIETVKLPNEGVETFYEDLLKSHKVDIAMSHFSHTGYKIFKKLGIPNITFIHNIYAMLRDEALENFINHDKYVDRYISVSKLATDYAAEKHGIERCKIVTIPNGLIIEEHQRRQSSPPANRSQFGVKDSDYLFLNVASYNLHKSHYLMAEAMRLILLKRDDIKILCVGNIIYPPHIKQLQSDIEDWGLSNHLLLPGYFDDVAPLHKAADAFLLPSLIEGWSIAMNEAMFYGKPMILTKTGGAPEVVIDNDIGLLLPNEYGAITNLDSYELDRIGYEQRKFQTAPYLASAMTQFADNRELWSKKGRKGHEKIMTHFNFSDVTDRYVDLCKEVLK